MVVFVRGLRLSTEIPSAPCALVASSYSDLPVEYTELPVVVSPAERCRPNL